MDNFLELNKNNYQTSRNMGYTHDKKLYSHIQTQVGKAEKYKKLRAAFK